MMNKSTWDSRILDMERLNGLRCTMSGLQTPTINNFLITMFQTRLQSYMRIATTRMMQTMLQHKEVTLLCKEGMTPTKAQSALLVPHIKNYNNTKTTYGTKKY
jgi:hypothetical protein